MAFVDRGSLDDLAVVRRQTILQTALNAVDVATHSVVGRFIIWRGEPEISWTRDRNSINRAEPDSSAFFIFPFAVYMISSFAHLTGCHRGVSVRYG